MTHKHTVLVIGMGDIGFGVIRELTQLPGVQIVACRRSEREGRLDRNLLATYAETHGGNSDITFEPVDVEDVDRTERLVNKYGPDVVLQCATALPYWRIQQLPDEVSERLLSAGLGWTAPMNLRYPMNVAEAIEQAGRADSTRLVNASIPDYTNVVLERLGLPCDCGIGNVGGGRISMLETGAAKRLGESRQDVTVFAGFPHVVAANLRKTKSTGGLPYYLKVLLRGEDVTADVDPDRTLKKDGWPEIPDLPPSGRGYPLAVASAFVIVRGMLWDTNELLHAPGPNGRPGGWPCRTNADGVDVVLPRDTSDAELTRVNEVGLAAEGIRSIEDDGTIVYTEESHKILEETLGYECRQLSVDDIEERHRQLETKLEDL